MKTYSVFFMLIIANSTVNSQTRTEESNVFTSFNARFGYDKTIVRNKQYTSYDYQLDLGMGLFISDKNVIGFNLGAVIQDDNYFQTKIFTPGIFHRYYFIKKENTDLFLQSGVGLRIGKLTESADEDIDEYKFTGFSFGTALGFNYPITKKIGLELQIGAINFIYDQGNHMSNTLTQNVSFFNSVSIGIRFK